MHQTQKVDTITNRTEAVHGTSYELQRAFLLASHQEAAQLFQAFTLKGRNHMAARMSYEHRIFKCVHQLVRPLRTADKEDQSKMYVHAEVLSQKIFELDA